mgnify:CR=1 FL=1
MMITITVLSPNFLVIIIPIPWTPNPALSSLPSFVATSETALSKIQLHGGAARLEYIHTLLY